MFCKHGLICISGLKFDIHQGLQGVEKFSNFRFQGRFLSIILVRNHSCLHQNIIVV